jgi:predicted nucleic acid-binding protein
MRDIAVVVRSLPSVTVCRDPHDNYLLALAAVGSADFLVTGDKRDLLSLGHYKGTRIMTVRDFLTLYRRLP